MPPVNFFQQKTEEHYVLKLSEKFLALFIKNMQIEFQGQISVNFWFRKMFDVKCNQSKSIKEVTNDRKLEMRL